MTELQILAREILEFGLKWNSFYLVGFVVCPVMDGSGSGAPRRGCVRGRGEAWETRTDGWPRLRASLRRRGGEKAGGTCPGAWAFRGVLLPFHCYFLYDSAVHRKGPFTNVVIETFHCGGCPGMLVAPQQQEGPWESRTGVLRPLPRLSHRRRLFCLTAEFHCGQVFVSFK